MHPILIKIGPVTIYTYGFFVFLGVLISYLVASKDAEKIGINKEIFSHIICWVLIFSFIGARLFYILVEFRNFLKDPLGLLLSRGGFVFYGGLIFGIFSLYFLTKKHNLEFLKIIDVISGVVPVGHSLGRIGCFFNGCCYGKPTTSWIGITFPPYSPAGLTGEKLIPTQLISSFFLFLLFLFLRFLKKNKRFDGEIALYYILIYSIFRFIIEFFRGDPRGHIFFLPFSQFISGILIIVSLLIMKKVYLKIDKDKLT
jgi:phosphatidylglycerol:prolipoprotein diacylglycerol transferase